MTLHSREISTLFREFFPPPRGGLPPYVRALHMRAVGRVAQLAADGKKIYEEGVPS